MALLYTYILMINDLIDIIETNFLLFCYIIFFKIIIYIYFLCSALCNHNITFKTFGAKWNEPKPPQTERDHCTWIATPHRIAPPPIATHAKLIIIDRPRRGVFCCNSLAGAVCNTCDCVTTEQMPSHAPYISVYIVGADRNGRTTYGQTALASFRV